jgi:hypothetical protein
MVGNIDGDVSGNAHAATDSDSEGDGGDGG